MKKIILFNLVIVLIFCLLSGCDSSNDFEYKDNGDGTCTITGYIGEQNVDLIIPPKINELTVKTIEDQAFLWNGYPCYPKSS